jgi:hypothetical protein
MSAAISHLQNCYFLSSAQRHRVKVVPNQSAETERRINRTRKRNNDSKQEDYHVKAKVPGRTRISNRLSVVAMRYL